MKNKKMIAVAASLLLILSAAPISFAQTTTPNTSDKYTLLAPLPCIPSPAKSYTDGNGRQVDITAVTCPEGDLNLQNQVSFQTYVQYAFNLFIAIAAVGSVFMIVWGGLDYMTAESISKKGAGVEKIRGAVGGLLLVLSAWLILRTVNPKFVEIPANLVKTLELPQNKNSTNDFFGPLNRTINNYAADIQAANINVQQAKDNISRLKNERDSLMQQYSAAAASGDYDKKTTIETALRKKESELGNAMGDLYTNLDIVSTRSEVIRYDPSKDDLDMRISNIKDVTETYLNSLKDSGQSQREQEIKNQELYAIGILKIQKEVSDVAADSEASFVSNVRSVTALIPLTWIPTLASKVVETATYLAQKESAVININAAVSNYGNNIQNEAMKAQFKATAESMITNIKSAKKK